MASENLDWYSAVTLAERLKGRAPLFPATVSEPSEHAHPDDARVQFSISSWKSQRPFDDAGIFDRRLSLDGLTEPRLRELVAEPPDDIRRRVGSDPEWVATIESALSTAPTFEFHGLLTERMKRNPAIGMLDAAAPFIRLALDRLSRGAAAIARRRADPPFDTAAVGGIFFPDLVHALLRIVERTMALELNVARLEGRLAGATPNERFASFVTQLHDPSRLRGLFAEYPVLARLIAEQTSRWVAVSLELLERLSEDFDALQSAFAHGGRLGPLVAASEGLADPHHGGRSVVIVEFRSATRIVYKAKSLAAELHFQDVLRWLSAAGFPHEFRTLTILDRGSHGWEEYAAPRECRSRDEVSRFYERTGACLALLYVMDATDFHAGNLIASGEHPLLIDLGALFHPHRSAPFLRSAASAARLADRHLRNSVLRVGLLPERLWGNEEHEGVDISGLGAPPGQTTPHAVAAWEESGTDTMRLVRKRKAIQPERNLPRLEGEAVDAIEHRDALVRGFRSAHALLAARRDALLAPDGPLARFSRDPVSVFLRSSRTYRRLLRESYHPDVLRDALDRDRLFDLLWVEVPGDDDLTGVIRYERDALWGGDIPCFTATPDARDLRLGNGERLADFFPEPSFDAVRRIVHGLDAADCDRQAWLVEASLATLPQAPRHAPSYRAVPSAAPADPDRMLAAAVAVGDRLDQLAFRTENDAAWIGLECGRGRAWSIARAGLDLDAGVPGIALFLAYLGDVADRASATTLARLALATMRTAISEHRTSLEGVGGFDGWGGIIYVLCHVGALWGRTDLVDEAEALAARVPEWLGADDDLDVFSGAAGCILALRSLRRCRPSQRVTTVAIACGDHLIASAKHDAARTGFLFGSAGIADALTELEEWTGLRRFRRAARDARAGALAGEPPDDDTLTREAERCGTPCGVETPGLTAGLAGIGFGWLRAARPDVVPSVLALEPPIAVRGAHGR